MNIAALSTGVVHRWATDFGGVRTEWSMNSGAPYAFTGCGRLVPFEETHEKVTCRNCIKSQYPAERGR